MTAILDIMDRTGRRTIIHPTDISGELWIDEEYCGQFVVHSGRMLLIHNQGLIEVYIGCWTDVGWRVGRG
jgi:hypothetical protein